jgi:hypothetical protein
MEENLDQNLAAAQVGPDTLINAVLGNKAPELGNQAPPPAAVEKYGDIPVTDFMPAFKAATGFETIDEVIGLREQIAQAEQWKAKAAELEAKVTSAPGFASPFVEKLNAVVASGADHAKLNAWWSLANTDLSQKSDIEVLVMQKQLQHPSMSPDMLKAYVLSEMGIEADGEIDLASLPAHKVAKLQIDAAGARAALDAEKAKIETVSAPQAQVDTGAAEMKKVESQQSVNFWGQFLGAVPAVIPFSIEDAEKGIPKYDFSFNPKPEAIAGVKNEILAAIAQNPNLFPKTEEGARQLQDTFNQMLQARSMADFQRAMFLDVYNAMKQEFVAKNAGQIPTQTTQPQKPQESRVPAMADVIAGLKR